MRPAIFIILAGLLLGTSLYAQEPLDDHSVILSGSDCQKVFDQMSRRAPKVQEGVRTPTAEQVKALWKALPAFVAGPPKLLRNPLDGFYRQYVGFVRGGRRFIYLNAFFRRSLPLDRYWREHPVVFGDGGSRYFGVEYDVEKGQLLNFESNGI